MFLSSFGIQRAYLYIGVLVMFYALLAIFAILKTPETKGTDLERDVRLA